MAVTYVNEETWRAEVMEAATPVVVDFYADWCGPCRMMDPLIKKFAEAHEGDLTVVKVDVDANQQLSAAFGISSIPTMLILDKGEVKKRLVGTRTLPVLEQEVQTALS